jgi:hypothetical protein
MRLPYVVRQHLPWWIGGHVGLGHKLAMQMVDLRVEQDRCAFGGNGQGNKSGADKRERAQAAQTNGRKNTTRAPVDRGSQARGDRERRGDPLHLPLPVDRTKLGPADH